MLFSHPAMLWGLLAVLIPVAIHLFSFRRYRKVYFSNVEELAEVQTESRRRSKVRRWLVLAARVLAVAMLALAFAGPFVPGRQAEVRSGQTAVSVYVDNTFSMEAASHDGGTMLADACDKARQVVAAYGADDRYQLLTADMGGRQMRWLSRDEFLAALDEGQPSPAVRTVAEVVQRQRSFMSGSSNRHAYVISDFQRSTAGLDALTPDSSSLVTLVPLGGTAADNIFIDTVVLDAPAYFAGGSVEVEVAVANSGTHDAERVPVRLYVDGAERAIRSVDVPAGTSVKVAMRFALPVDGWHDGMVKVEDYPVTYDDSYHFTLFAGGTIEVLEVGPEPSPHLGRLFAADSTIVLHRAQRLSGRDAQQASLIILDGLRQLPSGDAEWLADWVEDGGSLLVLPQADGVPAELNAMLARLHAPTLDRWVSRRSTASSIDYAGMLFRGVFAAHSDEMEMPSAQGHYLTGGQAVCQSVVTFPDGSNLLSMIPAGQGRVYLMTAPLDLTDFPKQALFVPTFYNMALYSRQPSVPCHTLGSMEPIVLHDEYDMQGRLPELSDGQDYSVIPDLRSVGGRVMMVPHGEPSVAGIYTLADEHLAFNYGRRESQLDFFTPAEVAEATRGMAGLAVLQPSGRPLDQVLRDRDGSRRLWRWCLLLALLALATETLLLLVKDAES